MFWSKSNDFLPFLYIVCNIEPENLGGGGGFEPLKPPLVSTPMLCVCLLSLASYYTPLHIYKGVFIVFQDLYHIIIRQRRVAFLELALFKSSGVICWHSTNIISTTESDVVRATGCKAQFLFSIWDTSKRKS